MKTRQFRTLTLSVLLTATSGCQIGEDDTTDGTKRENDNAAGLGEYCGELAFESVAWEEVTDIGVSGAAVFGAMTGSCTAPLTWDAALMGEGVCTPETGESEVTVTLTLDRESLKIGKYDNPIDASYYGCEDIYLQVRGEASIRSLDSVFDDAGEVIVLYSSTGGLGDIQLTVDHQDLGGNLVIDVDDGESAQIIYRFDGPGEVCAGGILLSVDRSLENGVAVTAIGDIGGWSDTGCPLGTSPVDLVAPLSDGKTITERFDEIWGERQFDAVWDNGDTTVLSIAAELDDTVGCREAMGIYTIPATITYGTADGSLVQRTVSGYAGITFSENDLVRGATIDITDDRFCSSANDDLGYGFGDCDTLSGVTIQLRIQRIDESWSVSDDALIAYEYDSGTTPGGGADRTRELTLAVE